MKKIQFMLALVFGLLSFNSYAQVEIREEKAPVERMERTQRGPERKATHESELKAKLNLTADQEVAYTAITRKYGTQMRDLRAANQADKQATRQEMKTLKEYKNRDLQEVLTPEQFAIFETETKGKRQSRMHKKGHRGKKSRS